MNLLQLFRRNDELDRLKRELELERKKNLNDLKNLNKKFRAIITNGEVEFVIKNISDIKDGK